MFTLTFTKNCNRSLSIKNVGKDQPIMMASSTLMSMHMVANIVLNIDLEGERFCYQCYISIYGLSKHLGGGGQKNSIHSRQNQATFFFNERSILVKLVSVSDSSDSIYFWICLLSSFLCSECPYFIIKSVWMSCLPTDSPLQKVMNQILPFSPLFQIHSTPARIWNRCQCHCFHILTISSKKGTP